MTTDLPPSSGSDVDPVKDATLILGGFEMARHDATLAKVMEGRSHPETHQHNLLATVFSTAVHDVRTLVDLWHLPWQHVEGKWKALGYWDRVDKACQAVQEIAKTDHDELLAMFTGTDVSVTEIEETIAAVQIDAQMRHRVQQAQAQAPALTSARARVRT